MKKNKRKGFQKTNVWRRLPRPVRQFALTGYELFCWSVGIPILLVRHVVSEIQDRVHKD